MRGKMDFPAYGHVLIDGNDRLWKIRVFGYHKHLQRCSYSEKRVLITFLRGVIMPKILTQWLICPLIASIVWRKKALTNFWIIISLLRVISSILIHLEPLFSSPGPFLGQNRAQKSFFDQKYTLKPIMSNKDSWDQFEWPSVNPLYRF